MVSKKEIFRKIRILITQSFNNPTEAFEFFDKNGDGFLGKSELIQLIKDAKINRFFSSTVADKMIEGLDEDQNEKFDWKEFKKALKKLIEETD